MFWHGGSGGRRIDPSSRHLDSSYRFPPRACTRKMRWHFSRQSPPVGLAPAESVPEDVAAPCFRSTGVPLRVLRLAVNLALVVVNPGVMGCASAAAKRSAAYKSGLSGSRRIGLNREAPPLRARLPSVRHFKPPRIRLQGVGVSPSPCIYANGCVGGMSSCPVVMGCDLSDSGFIHEGRVPLVSCPPGMGLPEPMEGGRQFIIMPPASFLICLEGVGLEGCTSRESEAQAVWRGVHPSAGKR